MRDLISTSLTKLVYHSGYRTAAMFVANGVGLLTLFTVLTAHAISAQVNGIPAPTAIDLWGVTFRDILASVGSAGAAYGFMLFRVKKLEDEVTTKVGREHLQLVTDNHKNEVLSLASVVSDLKDEVSRLRDVQTEHYKEMLRVQVKS